MSTTIIVNEDIPTPEELAEDMRRIAEEFDDQEMCHRIMDGTLTDVLEKLGYAEAVEIFINTPKWYA